MGDMERRPNQDQLRVVEDLDNNIILFASAGTGKTFTVEQRGYKIYVCGYEEVIGKVHVLTFIKQRIHISRKLTVFVTARFEKVVGAFGSAHKSGQI